MVWAIGSEVICISLLLVTSIFLDSDRIAGYSMDIDTDSFGTPNTDCHAHIIMPAAEFTRIVCDLLLLGRSKSVKKGFDLPVRGKLPMEMYSSNTLTEKLEPSLRKQSVLTAAFFLSPIDMKIKLEKEHAYKWAEV